MKIEQVTRKTITCTTEELAKLYVECMLDMGFDTGSLVPDLQQTLEVFCQGDFPKIVNLFQCGMTPMFMGAMLEEIEKAIAAKQQIEIRVMHKGKPLGVVLTSDIQY